jgi:hypothetical protein
MLAKLCYDHSNERQAADVGDSEDQHHTMDIRWPGLILSTAAITLNILNSSKYCI